MIRNSLAPPVLLGGGEGCLIFGEGNPGVLPLRATVGKGKRNRSRTGQMTTWWVLLYRRSFCSFPALERGRVAPTTTPVQGGMSGGQRCCWGGPGALGTEPTLAKPEQPLPGPVPPLEWRGGTGWWTHHKINKYTHTDIYLYIYIYLPSMWGKQPSCK